ncbi:MAG: alpha/beta hydrolase [Atopobiaceae bacterium]
MRQVPVPSATTKPLRQASQAAPAQVRSLAWITRLPSTTPRKAAEPEKPGPMPFVRLFATLIALLFVAWAAYFIGMWPLTIVFVAACVVGFIGARNVGLRYMTDAFGHFDGMAPSPAASQRVDATAGDASNSENASDAEAAPRRIEPGGILLDPADARAQMLLAPLPKSRRRSIEAARQAEAQATAQWLQQAGGMDAVQTTSADGTRLVGHAVTPAAGSNRWVIYAHDYHGSWTDGLLYARHYAQKGYGVLLVQMRGHGDSEGRWIGMGYLDSRDLIAWCCWIMQNYGERVSIALHGTSMGAAAALLAASDATLPSQVRAVVSENAYTDAWNEAITFYHGLGFDVHPAIDLVRKSLRGQEGGYDFALANPYDSADELAVPTLFAHSAHDTLVPAYFSVQLWRKANEARPELGHRVASFDHAGHQLTCLADADPFYQTLFGFLDPLMA